MMKIRQRPISGDTVTETLGQAMEREFAQAGGHGYGQVEQLEADIRVTQEFLVRVIDVFGETLDREKVYKLFGRHPADTAFDSFEVIEEDDG